MYSRSFEYDAARFRTGEHSRRLSGLSPLLGYFFAAARLAAHIFLVAATISALPAALSLRFFLVPGFGVGGADALGSDLPLAAAHLLRWASAMALRPAALIFRRGRFVGTVAE